jgi:hypothetical protein
MPRLLNLCLVLSLLGSFALADSLAAAIPLSEREALLDLYDHLNGEVWGSISDAKGQAWGGPAGTECSWRYVRCTDDGMAVASLRIPAGVAGEVPASLAALTMLDTLQLAGGLTGTVPEALRSLVELRHIDLSGNHLSGEIPGWLDDLPYLVTLQLADNDLTGSIPVFDRVPPMLQLKLAGNHLSGEIPAGLTKIQNVDLGRNLFVGKVPRNWPEYQHFASYNALTWPEGYQLDHTQTLPPKGLQALDSTSDSITFGWVPIDFRSGPGFYQVHYAGTPEGPFVPVGSPTPDKQALTTTITGLPPGRTWYFAVSTTSLPYYNRNTITSPLGEPIAATTCMRPRFVSQPQSQAVVSGTSATLSVTATDAGAFETQWFVYSIGSFFPIEGATGSQFTTPPVTGPQQYLVQLSNGCGAVRSETVRVTVMAYPAVSFQAARSCIAPGESTTLTWNVKGADEISIEGIATSLPANGSLSVSPGSSTDYRLHATNAAGTSTVTATVEVTPLPTVLFDVYPRSIEQGESVTLSWNVTDANTIQIAPIGAVIESDRQEVKPDESTRYVLTATSYSGSTVRGIDVEVRPVPPDAPRVQFSATPSVITPGGTSRLEWTADRATSVQLEGVDGALPFDGSMLVNPEVTTTYRLIVIGPGGTRRVSARVVVDSPPVIQFWAQPAVVREGEETTLYWSVEGADRVAIGGLGYMEPTGSAVVRPSGELTSYTLSATGPGGAASSVVTVRTGSMRRRPSRH